MFKIMFKIWYSNDYYNNLTYGYEHDVLNKKNSKGANAAMLSNKQQSGSLGCFGAGSWMGGGPLAVCTNVFLKSLSSGNKDVAIATIVSCDPKYKLDGVEIINHFWAVHVNAAFVKTEELVRKWKNCTILGNAEGRRIAWPSTFIQKING